MTLHVALVEVADLCCLRTDRSPSDRRTDAEENKKPKQVHLGSAPEVIRQRQEVLAAAYAARPERFVAGPPRAAGLPEEVWINPPLPVSAVDDGNAGNDGVEDTGEAGTLN